MKNGRADHDDDEPPRDPKIARLEDERRRRQLGIGGRPQGGSGSKARRSSPGGGSVKEWIIGGVLVAMALGFVISAGASLLQAAGVLPR